MAADIDSLPWMSDETKKQALIKLKAVTNKIGYPDKWRDYSPGDCRRMAIISGTMAGRRISSSSGR